jgi:CRP-like cAMP-binding protein
MIYKLMEFQDMDKNDYVMKIGDFGEKFFIILKGKVSVRVHSNIERNFKFRELLELFLKNQEWIVENQKYQKILNLVHELIPEIIKENYNKENYINFDLLKRILNGTKTVESLILYDGKLPTFENLRDPFQENDEKYLAFNMVLEVVQLGPGVSFGELALIEDKVRSATIVCLEDTRFATLSREPFDRVIGKMIKKNFKEDIEFLSNLTLLKGLTRKTKQKL